jgi:RNA polymerase sigma-70 factor (ECF subfamily)
LIQNITLTEREQIALLEKLFKQYQPMLVSFAYNYLKTSEDSKGIVQDVFIAVWNNRENLRLDGNLKSYLFTATKNKCLNFIEKKRLQTVSLESSEVGDFAPASRIAAKIPDTTEIMEAEELRAVIFDEIQKLPPKCRAIFVLSREEGLSYKEIAQKLEVSAKTVENQIGIALKRIRARVTLFEQQNNQGGRLSSAVLALIITKVVLELGVGQALSV